MRHLELINFGLSDQADAKEESLDLGNIKEDIPNLILSQYEGLIKQNLQSDDSIAANDLDIPLSPVAESDEESESLGKQNIVLRKNRRKPLLPQRAVQSETSRNSSLENSSECSQDAIDNSAYSFSTHLLTSSVKDEFFDLADGDDLLQDIDEENIFKGLREEAGLYLA